MMKQLSSVVRSRLLPAILLGIGLSAACSCFTGCTKEPPPTPPPPEVAVASVVQKDVPIHAEWVGTADGLINATIRAQVTGYLSEQNYQEGDLVKKGDVLFEIDPRPFQAALDQSKGELALQQARWETSKLNLNRIRPLAEANAVSKKDLDEAIGAEQATHAAVLAAQAAVQKAQIDLDFTKIRSPIVGVAGRAKAQIGDLVGTPQSSELTTVSTIDPVKVYFSISEQEYLQFMREGTPGEQRERRRQQNLELLLADGSLYSHKGTFAFADRQVDVRTGTITVAALFPNPGGLLRPGQFAKIRAVTKQKEGALLVPQRAVTELQGSYQVAVVSPDNKVSIRPVKVGSRVDALWVVEEGLKPGEHVVAEGTQKVREGLLVTTRSFDVKSEADQQAVEPSSRPATRPESTSTREN